jgi:mannitol/fructose-specific phosphotransferase system IIA component (Ntr-type)
MKRVLAIVGRLITSAGQPGVHPIDGMLWLEWSLANRVALKKGLCPWERLSGPDEVPPGLYEAFRAGKLLEHPGGDLALIVEALADGHPNAYRRGGREDLLMRMRPLGPAGFVLGRDGVAVTHPRSPLVLPVSGPVITVCRAQEPVLLGPDGSTPVSVFLCVMGPTVGAFLGVLARLSRLLARDRFVEVLLGAGDREELTDLVWLHDCGLADEDINVPRGWG